MSSIVVAKRAFGSWLGRAHSSAFGINMGSKRGMGDSLTAITLSDARGRQGPRVWPSGLSMAMLHDESDSDDSTSSADEFPTSIGFMRCMVRKRECASKARREKERRGEPVTVNALDLEREEEELIVKAVYKRHQELKAERFTDVYWARLKLRFVVALRRRRLCDVVKEDMARGTGRRECWREVRSNFTTRVVKSYFDTGGADDFFSNSGLAIPRVSENVQFGSTTSTADVRAAPISDAVLRVARDGSRKDLGKRRNKNSSRHKREKVLIGATGIICDDEKGGFAERYDIRSLYRDDALDVNDPLVSRLLAVGGDSVAVMRSVRIATSCAGIQVPTGKSKPSLRLQVLLEGSTELADALIDTQLTHEVGWWRRRKVSLMYRVGEEGEKRGFSGLMDASGSPHKSASQHANLRASRAHGFKSLLNSSVRQPRLGRGCDHPQENLPLVESGHKGGWIPKQSTAVAPLDPIAAGKRGDDSVQAGNSTSGQGTHDKAVPTRLQRRPSLFSMLDAKKKTSSEEGQDGRVQQSTKHAVGDDDVAAAIAARKARERKRRLTLDGAEQRVAIFARRWSNSHECERRMIKSAQEEAMQKPIPGLLETRLRGHDLRARKRYKSAVSITSQKCILPLGTHERYFGMIRSAPNAIRCMMSDQMVAGSRVDVPIKSVLAILLSLTDPSAMARLCFTALWHNVVRSRARRQIVARPYARLWRAKAQWAVFAQRRGEFLADVYRAYLGIHTLRRWVRYTIRQRRVRAQVEYMFRDQRLSLVKRYFKKWRLNVFSDDPAFYAMWKSDTVVRLRGRVKFGSWFRVWRTYAFFHKQIRYRSKVLLDENDFMRAPLPIPPFYVSVCAPMLREAEQRDVEEHERVAKVIRETGPKIFAILKSYVQRVKKERCAYHCGAYAVQRHAFAKWIEFWKRSASTRRSEGRQKKRRTNAQRRRDVELRRLAEEETFFAKLSLERKKMRGLKIKLGRFLEVQRGERPALRELLRERSNMIQEVMEARQLEEAETSRVVAEIHAAQANKVRAEMADRLVTTVLKVREQCWEARAPFVKWQSFQLLRQNVVDRSVDRYYHRQLVKSLYRKRVRYLKMCGKVAILMSLFLKWYSFSAWRRFTAFKRKFKEGDSKVAIDKVEEQALDATLDASAFFAGVAAKKGLGCAVALDALDDTTSSEGEQPEGVVTVDLRRPFGDVVVQQELPDEEAVTESYMDALKEPSFRPRSTSPIRVEPEPLQVASHGAAEEERVSPIPAVGKELNLVAEAGLPGSDGAYLTYSVEELPSDAEEMPEVDEPTPLSVEVEWPTVDRRSLVSLNLATSGMRSGFSPAHSPLVVGKRTVESVFPSVQGPLKDEHAAGSPLHQLKSPAHSAMHTFQSAALVPTAPIVERPTDDADERLQVRRAVMPDIVEENPYADLEADVNIRQGVTSVASLMGQDSLLSLHGTSEVPLAPVSEVGF